LCVTALADSVRQAQRAAYAAIADLGFAGMQFRKDIGYRALVGRGARSETLPASADPIS